MIRKIIQIDEEKCNGCGICADACHEGAIGLVDGKAKLLREHYCDGLGDCLPACPTGAISFVEREAAAYDEKAVEAAKNATHLRQWPVQLKLMPLKAPWYQGAKLLVAADCSAYAYRNFHQDFMKDHITLVGCPKLDGVDYSIKLTEILKQNEISAITVVRMEVPCCGGIQYAVGKAIANCGKTVPCQVVTLSTDGKILRK